jgi:hypothetical protein
MQAFPFVPFIEPDDDSKQNIQLLIPTITTSPIKRILKPVKMGLVGNLLKCILVGIGKYFTHQTTLWCSDFGQG